MDYKARFYDPYINRFLQPDSIIPNLSNPQSLNRYSYVLNQPTRFSDPTGHWVDEGCGSGKLCELPPEDKKKDDIPSWWRNNRYVYVEGYGTFDIDHIERGWESAEYLVRMFKLALARGGGVFDAVSYGDFLRSNYIVSYSVSGTVTQDQMAAVLYGIYTDFECSYEQHQGRRLVDFFSSFTPEDLPSDHIGFWAYINGIDYDEIPGVLERLGKVSPTIPSALAVDTITSRGQTAIIGFPKNREFLPMVPQMTDYGGGTFEIRWQNVSWPSWLEIAPIPSGLETWQRVE
jgi:hypothetical protein